LFLEVLKYKVAGWPLDFGGGGWKTMFEQEHPMME